MEKTGGLHGLIKLHVYHIWHWLSTVVSITIYTILNGDLYVEVGNKNIYRQKLSLIQQTIE